MAHLLMLEIPFDDDHGVVEGAARLGHRVTVVTAYADAAQTLRTALPGRDASDTVVIEAYAYEALEAFALALHARRPIDAVICVLDVCIVDASRLAERLGLRFLAAGTARLMRDKSLVRARLADHGIEQPRFSLARSPDELDAAIERIGWPCIVKPVDGFASQWVTLLRDEPHWQKLRAALRGAFASPGELGTSGEWRGPWLVESFAHGTMVGCDTFTVGGRHIMLGVNEKMFFAPPSFAVRGGCFPSSRFDMEPIGRYVSDVLDALGFDFGAAHTEISITCEGPRLIEVNPRLVGSGIPKLLGLALDRSLYEDLIALHLGSPMTELGDARPVRFAASRWITAPRNGVLRTLAPPEHIDPRVRRIALLHKPGDLVSLPYNNGNRLGCVMAVGATQEEAEQVAEQVVRDTRVEVDPEVQA